jgi:Undecaprenyl-phosphate glucose phosphotransferase
MLRAYWGHWHVAFDLKRASSLSEESLTGPATPVGSVWTTESSVEFALDYPAKRQRGDRRVSLSVICGLLRVADCVIVFAASWLAFELYLVDRGAASSSYILLGLVGSVLAGNTLQMSGAYQPRAIRDPLSALGGMIQVVVVVAVVLIVVAFLTQTSAAWSRFWAGLWFIFTIVGLTGARAGLLMLMRRWAEDGSLRRNIAVVGAGAEAERLLAHVANAGDRTIQVVGLFDNRASRVPKSVAGHPVRGRIADLREFMKEMPVDEVIVAIPWTAEDSLVSTFRQLRCLPVDVRLAPGPIGYHLLSRPISHLAQLPLLHVADRPLDDWGRMVKWLEDRILGAVILMLIAVPMAVIALAVKLDSPGPVLFRQKRYGFNNQLIEVLKFRTMRNDQCNAEGSVLTMRNDPRITRLGRVLRKTSLDELPQLINILRGEMSIVGPRPHAIEAKAANRLYQDVVAEYAARHKVKPGLTGWAQINGWRGPTDTEDQIVKRVEHDLWYLENWSLVLDLKIIVLTLFKGFMGKDAY